MQKDSLNLRTDRRPSAPCAHEIVVREPTVSLRIEKPACEKTSTVSVCIQTFDDTKLTKEFFCAERSIARFAELILLSLYSPSFAASRYGDDPLISRGSSYHISTVSKAFHGSAEELFNKHCLWDDWVKSAAAFLSTAHDQLIR